MSKTFTCKCPFCGADIAVDANDIPEKVTCNTCGKEVAIQREVFYSGEIFSGEF